LHYAIAVADIAAVESFQFGVNEGRSAGVSLLATAGAAVLTPLLAVAIFGSCPTVYSNESGTDILEAESFPNSIAPLFEMRDVDRLNASPNAQHALRLSVRNEALETHYINHINLVEAIHEPGDLVVPTKSGRPIALREFVTTGITLDRRGTDVTTILSTADSLIYETAAETIGEADSSNLWDFLYLTIPLTPGRNPDSAYVYLRLRNSLLGTVFFYDYMLAGRGPQSVKWLADDLEVIGEALKLADFYSTRMGLRIDVAVDGAYKEVGRVREVGPIAFDHIAVPIPVTVTGDVLEIRLRFIPDAWRIDQVGIALEATYPPVRDIGISNVVVAQNASTEWAELIVDGISENDETYGVTGPGQDFEVVFDVGPDPQDLSRTFFIGMQGYYVEWIRGSWLRENPVASQFTPSDESLLDAMHRWTTVKEDFEQQFFSSKIPTAGGASYD
jgi:hypothetical protein